MASRFNSSTIWFPALLIFSVALHGGVIAIARWETPPQVLTLVQEESMMEVELVEEIPPEPEPEPEPPVEEMLPEPEVEPEPELEEPVLEDPPEVEEVVPEATPEPTPTPKPVSKPLPKPRPVSTPRPQPVRQPIVQKAAPETYRNPPPQYPQTARRNEWQGKVIVRAIVNPAGRVESVSVFRSSGHSVLDRAALDAVRRWRFRPGTVNGEPSRSTVEVPVNFRLE